MNERKTCCPILEKAHSNTLVMKNYILEGNEKLAELLRFSTRLLKTEISYHTTQICKINLSQVKSQNEIKGN